MQFQQRAARLAADGCDASMATDTEEEDVKQMVAEVVEWILSGTAADDDAPFSEVRRECNAQVEELVPGQGMPARRMERKLDRIRRNGQMQLKSRTQHCLR